MAKGNVLIVDRDIDLKKGLMVQLKKAGFGVKEVSTAAAALEALDQHEFEAICTELGLEDVEGVEWVSQLKGKKQDLPIFIMAPLSKPEAALDVIKAGAYDFLPKPFDPEELILKLRVGLEREKARRKSIRGDVGNVEGHEFSSIVAKSPQMNEIFSTIRKISEYKTTCLLMGESGTGKELVARAIHVNSSRRDRPFITVNCGAIPENLLESELFGHIKGAFTGAVKSKKGLFEEAHNGTLFLDEIGELPLILQVKLLRALQEEEIRRVGEANSIKVNVRIIAATVRDLAREVEQGTFREDLYYRLHVLPIFLPPLRDRTEDIPILVNHFIDKYNRKLSSQVDEVDPKVMKRLMDHDWPGNVRELENTIERAMVLTSGSRIRFEDLPLALRESVVGDSGALRFSADELSIKKMGRMMEEELISKALARSQGNRTKAAKLLEISHRALLYKIKRYKLDDSSRSSTDSGS